MTRRYGSTLALFLLLLTAVLAACGPKGTAPVATPTPTLAPAPGLTPTAPGPTPTEIAATTTPTGGVFRRLWDEPPTLDPHLTTDTASAGIIVEVFSGLVALDTDLNLVPELAERWEVSQDSTVYTFYLRPDAKFHSGRSVTAGDVKYSIERAADPKTLSPVADIYLADIVGALDKLNGRASEVRGVQVIDQHTVQFTLDSPKAYFLAKLTYPTAYVVDRENIEKDGTRWTQRPNGTGAFKLKEYKVGERIILERNPLYYRGPAKLDQVVFILSGGSAMAMYENNEIDITGVGLADLERVRNPQSPLNKELVVSPPGFEVAYIGFNVKQPPFDDAKVRQAMTYAINKDLIAKQVLADLVVPAYGILPPGFPGFNPAPQGLHFDADKATQLLAESKYAQDFPRVVLTVPGTGGSVGLDLEAILETWRQVLGIQVEIQQVEFATFLQDLNAHKLQLFAGLGWQADYPDPSNFLDVLFHSNNSLNHTDYHNEEVDRLLEQARTETQWEARAALYQQAEGLIIQDASVVPLWFGGEQVFLLKPYVKGYRPTPLIVPKLKDVYLAK
ncbi:MAG: peptide ABC transporter substrate-binding protein [Chloroflexi bacterium]|nr:peptide ABC transporter substrate-binding protein [Chloroflexota bacterium]